MDSSLDVPRGLAQRVPFHYGWVVVGVSFVTMAIGVNIRTAFSLLYPPILAEFGWSRAETAGAFSLGFLASAALTPVLGVLMDRFGPRVVTPTGSLVVASGLALATQVSQPWHLYLSLGLLVVGGTVIFSYIGHSMFLPLWFQERRGLAIGIAFSGVGVGSIVLFPWFQSLIDAIGWRETCWTMAGLLLAVVLPLNLLLQRHRPETLGMAPYGAEAHPQAATSTEAPGEQTTAPAAAAPAVDWTLRQALRTEAFWWICVANFCGLTAWYMIQVHQTKFLVELGIESETAAYALGLVGLTGIVGQIGVGYLSDRIGREWAWTLAGSGFVGCYVTLLVMEIHPSEGLMYAMVMMQGFLGYGLASIFGVIPTEIFKGRSVAKIFGLLSLPASVGAAFGPWFAGYIRDNSAGYTPAFGFAILCSLMTIFYVWLAAPRKGPRRGPYAQAGS